MSGHGKSPGDRDDRLDEVVAAYLKELDSGVMPDRRAWLTRHPEFYDELSDFFGDREQIESITAPLRDIGSADNALALEGLDPPSHPENLGRLGEYELIDWVGQGGMGVVFRGFDGALNRYVAIKLLAPQWSADALARRRFTREAQAAAAVSHPHVVTIHAVSEWRGRPYLVMEYINGSSLQHRIDEGGPLELPEILRIGSQIAAGLAAAHAKGLIHRDIKPANIMLENDLPRVKLTDFGLARAVDDAKLTQYGTLAGTPQYMAPEQARGEGMDRRTDLFSLGSVLYAMCTGRPAFAGESTVEVIRRVCDDTPAPIASRNPEIPGWLVEIIERLHRKQPSDRFQSAAEVADLLERHLARLEDPSLPPVDHDWAGGPPSAAGAAILRRVARSRWTGSVLLVLLGAGIAFEAMRFLAPRSDSERTPAGVGRDGPPANDIGIRSGAETGTGESETKRPKNQAQTKVVQEPWVLPPGAPIPGFDASRLRQAYHQSFLDRRYDFRRFRISAPGGATNLVRPDVRGVRITIPAKLGGSVAIETKFAIHGDFDLRARYEILAAPKPILGFGVGPELLVKHPGNWDRLASLSRFTRPKDTVYSASFVRKVDDQRQVIGNWPSNSTTKGSLRLVRTGPTLHYLVAEENGPEFQQIYQVEFGAEDLEMARLAAVTGGSTAAVDILWKDLEVRAEALPGLPDITKAAGRSPWWLLSIGGVVLAIAGLAVWLLASAQRQQQQRRATADPPAEPRAPVTVADDEWDDDALRKLEVNAAAYAAGHPDAETYTERPRFAFSLRDGQLHGPFVVWAPLDKAGMKRLGAGWEAICEKLPKRFEGGYRHGQRNGVFLYRNGSGKPRTRRYRDGEHVQ